MSLSLTCHARPLGDDEPPPDDSVPPSGGLTTWSPNPVPPTGGLYDYGVRTPPDEEPSTAGMAALAAIAIFPLLLL